ncbi:unnamed protein product [Leptidea sinapis]|uniref:Uncharacterized protein n=1 Tax=Leptidea sinapis TaxID=189913 RepID=A0A5E4PSY9_9NEOP|nr:unnamed protein product [Leptidea sinapis]
MIHESVLNIIDLGVRFMILMKQTVGNGRVCYENCGYFHLLLNRERRVRGNVILSSFGKTKKPVVTDRNTARVAPQSLGSCQNIINGERHRSSSECIVVVHELSPGNDHDSTRVVVEAIIRMHGAGDNPRERVRQVGGTSLRDTPRERTLGGTPPGSGSVTCQSEANPFLFPHTRRFIYQDILSGGSATTDCTIVEIYFLKSLIGIVLKNSHTPSTLYYSYVKCNETESCQVCGVCDARECDSG